MSVMMAEITIIKATGDTPTFDSTAVTAFQPTIKIDQQYVIIDGLTVVDSSAVANVPYSLISTSASNVEIRNIQSTDGPDDGDFFNIDAGVTQIRFHDNTISNVQNCGVWIASNGTTSYVYIYNNSMTDVGEAGTDGRAAIQTPANAVSDLSYLYVYNNTVASSKKVAMGFDKHASGTASNLYVYDNTITNTSDSAHSGEAIAVSWTNVEIYRNTITGGEIAWGVLNWIVTAGAQNVNIYDNKVSGITGTAFSAQANLDDTFSAVNIHHNLAYNNDGMLRVHNAGGVASTTINGASYYNVTYGNTAYDIKIDDVAGWDILNNTMSGSGAYGIWLLQTASNSIIKNNIINEPGGYLVNVSANSQSGIDIDYNLYYDSTGKKWKWGADADDTSLADWRTATSDEASSQDSAPLFTDEGGNDYTLQSGSPAINAGVDLGASYDDALNSVSSWPLGVVVSDQDLFGTGWEIGAYIYSRSGGGTFNMNMNLK
jgi:parallel beta-helix repeat protein